MAIGYKGTVMDNMTTWRYAITHTLNCYGETWDDVLKCTLTDDELDVSFDAGYGIEHGKPFTLWTRKRVYFPVCYDGREWCESVPRKPCNEATRHLGGG